MNLRHHLTAVLLIALSLAVRAQTSDRTVIASGWRLQEASKVVQSGEELSRVSFSADQWFPATVPGTVLTTLVNNKVYPEPLYGENNRPDRIPERLCRTDWWYRAAFPVPSTYAGRKIWLNFDGINYAAEVWVNGKSIGAIKGAFIRGLFEITSLVTPGKEAAVAVRVSPQPHPGVPYEHIIGGRCQTGGLTAIDGPTFLCSISWDWMPGIRDRNTGIWQKVFLTSTGPVAIKAPFVTTDLPLPRCDSAEVTVQATVQNVTGFSQTGVLKGSFGDVSFQKAVDLDAGASKTLTFDPKTFPQLHLTHPQLWWPNGYGPQYLQTLHLSFDTGGSVSDAQDVTFGIRKITYEVPGTGNLALSVNGVRIFCKGGDWGMDEAMKRIPRERLEAQVRMHQIANYTMIRNWVGQSTSADLYDLCDKYGMLLWDEFFQANPHDAPNPTDLDTYVANVRDKVLRFRNHPSIALWCARNEGYPPNNINEALYKLLKELDPIRHYQPSSTDGKGVRSGGPYGWRKPVDYYRFPEDETFKTEIGSDSIPTLESIQGMMPKADWNTINDDWAEHDAISGDGRNYPVVMAMRYGKIANMADFARKGQLMNYEAFRAMYEGRQAKLFNPVQGVLTWMSQPAQPSFVWQIYHYDLEPNSALFAVRKACEPVHIQLNEQNGTVQVINNLPTPLSGGHARIALHNLDGSSAYQHDYAVAAAPSAATTLGAVASPSTLSPVYFVKLELRNAAGKLLSDNFYWRAVGPKSDNLTALDTLPVANVGATVVRRSVNGKLLLDITLQNLGPHVALMARLQLCRGKSKGRVLPVYYTDNYISLLLGEDKTVTIEAALADLKGEHPLVLVDGWNVAVNPVSSAAADIALNAGAQVNRWPRAGLPFIETKFPLLEELRINCGGGTLPGWREEPGQGMASCYAIANKIDTRVPMAAPEAVYRSEMVGKCPYTFYFKSLPAGQSYRVRLHFLETQFAAPGERLFGVNINEKPVLTDFDIFQEVGGKDKALVKQFSGIVPERSGRITIDLKMGKSSEPQICGIEIEKE